MSAESDSASVDVLGGWVERTSRTTGARARRTGIGQPGLRFAFYGRVSTEDFQDRVSSARWQRTFAEDLIAGHGAIVAEFFDVGYSRRVAWADRPQAAKLLAALADPDRGFDAIVVGEFERAFYGNQFASVAALLDRSGVQLWLPEVDGPVDVHSLTHQALMMLLGVHSKREVLRSRYRVTAAMRAQASEQGRHLGGRPPYGYRLVDAGPHPNRAHARWGRRLHRLEPDPATAPHVKWIFERRLAGHSVASIARELNTRGIPCPSGMDPERNRHRSGAAWTLGTVAAILANPRYTGRQVWNRQRTDRDPRYDGGDLLGHTDVHRWNPAQQWAISKAAAHPALVSEETFVAAQAIRTAPTPRDGTSRRFLLSGLLLCGLCGRQMDAHWVHGRAGYRCRHGHTSVTQRGQDRPKNLYVREDHALAFVTAHLGQIGLRHPVIATDQVELAALLHSNDIMITCGRAAWTLEAERQIIGQAPPPRPGRAKPLRIPRSRAAASPLLHRRTSMSSVGK